MNPRTAFCQFTSPSTTFTESVELTKRFGFEGFSIVEMMLGEESIDGLVDVLSTSGLKAADCIPTNISPIPTVNALPFDGPADSEERIRLMCESVERLAKFAPDTVLMVTGSKQGWDIGDARRIVVEGLREAARTAARHGFKISLEPIRDSAWDASFVYDIPDSLRLVEEVGEPNVDIACDVWHLWDTPEIIDLLERHAGALSTVHVNDWIAEPAALGDRGFPGEGQIDLKKIFGALDRGGFTGWYNVEVFSSKMGDLPVEEIFRRSYDGFWSAWNERY